MRFGVWEGLQWIGNGCGLQMDGFSAHFDQLESIFSDFHDFGHFAIVFHGLLLFPEGPRTLRDRPEGPGTVWEGVYGGLMLLPEGPRTLRECHGGPWTLSECPARLVGTPLDKPELVGTCCNLSQLVGTCRNLSRLVQTCLRPLD